MSKIHSQTRIIDNKGLARLQTYCANHTPQVSWRPVSNDDIGIDGEIELYSDEGHRLSEIIKVQLKSTETDKSYIKNENPVNGTFTFYAEKSDVEYWQELSNDVLLVIFDNRSNQNKLFAKKIENIDLRNTGTKLVPIRFDQNADILNEQENDFLNRFSRKYNSQNPVIKTVIRGDEILYSNLLRITFPSNKIYVAPINYDRGEIIRDSWNTDKPLSHKAYPNDVAWKALRQKGLNFSSDWTTHNNQIITFHDLNDNSVPLSQIVESPIDSLSPEEFYTVNADYKMCLRP